MKDGRVLVIGKIIQNRTLKSCEIFNLVIGQWSLTDSLKIERENHSAVLLPDGKVLVTGGGNPDSSVIFTSELFDPVTERWKKAGITSCPHYAHSSVLLAGSLILLVGGMITPESGKYLIPRHFFQSMWALYLFKSMNQQSIYCQMAE